MAKVTSKSNDFLFNVKKTTSAKIYSVLLELENVDTEYLRYLYDGIKKKIK